MKKINGNPNASFVQYRSVHTVVYIQLYICYTVNLLAELLTLGLLGTEMPQ